MKKECQYCKIGTPIVPGIVALRMPKNSVEWFDNHWHKRCDLEKHQNNKSFCVGSDTYHVLRILANGQISAARGRELILSILNGINVDIPDYEA